MAKELLKWEFFPFKKIYLRSPFFPWIHFTKYLFSNTKYFICHYHIQVLNEDQHKLAAKHEYNFDHPDAFVSFNKFKFFIAITEQFLTGF